MMYVGTSADIKVKRKYHSEDQGSKTKTKPVGNVLLACLQVACEIWTVYRIIILLSRERLLLVHQRLQSTLT
ncbi:hypothetical protein MGG_16117 [Pyricularia oryzae 70-15]|uniref:Uncharacterized protein n=3 Tax=Pyricularia oryzae TaxID=318829 RepID=G4MRD8_PYRO7|nr:uncharacterized protein MGG_16117 [Pyricularia oryzae 70-15]EHA56565.1 hypothetical protein MGG_16117 [Pyricularia oryzae 70-15]ELQ35807.1 hypothetical protein OOU_Y34scaffold00686g4 [Pyricularia oryzae Y34]KAI7916240.1 hypothetical protein M0657_008698 [Pyricularia oryzae]KAI7920687.1 hypothetical protein M9X92_005772 [Pyricularia oryzae]